MKTLNLPKIIKKAVCVNETGTHFFGSVKSWQHKKHIVCAFSYRFLNITPKIYVIQKYLTPPTPSLPVETVMFTGIFLSSPYWIQTQSRERGWRWYLSGESSLFKASSREELTVFSSTANKQTKKVGTPAKMHKKDCCMLPTTHILRTNPDYTHKPQVSQLILFFRFHVCIFLIYGSFSETVYQYCDIGTKKSKCFKTPNM